MGHGFDSHTHYQFFEDMNINNEEKYIIGERVFNLLLSDSFMKDFNKFVTGDVENADEYESYLRLRIFYRLFPEEKDGQDESKGLI
jgi:hypothetical protein